MEIITKETIVTNNLVVHVDANNRNSYSGSGTTWTDLSGNGNNGTLNTTSISYNKESLIFDPGEYVNFSQYNFGNEFTLCCFIKPSDLSSIRTLFANSTSGSITSGIRIFINFELANTRTLHIELGNGSSGQLITSASNTVTYNTWQQVAFTLNKNTSKGIIYHNGIKVKEETLSFTNYNSNAAFRFGTMFSDNYVYGGALANYLLYNRALTESEIQQNYDNQKGRFFGQSNMTLSGISITQS